MPSRLTCGRPWSKDTTDPASTRLWSSLKFSNCNLVFIIGSLSRQPPLNLPIHRRRDGLNHFIIDNNPRGVELGAHLSNRPKMKAARLDNCNVSTWTATAAPRFSSLILRPSVYRINLINYHYYHCVMLTKGMHSRLYSSMTIIPISATFSLSSLFLALLFSCSLKVLERSEPDGLLDAVVLFWSLRFLYKIYRK